MKKFVYLSISFFIFVNFTLATELKGGVSFNVNSAREYLKAEQVDRIEMSGSDDIQKNRINLAFVNDNTIRKKVYSYNNSGDITGITVQYKNEPNKAYIYGKNNNLIYIDKYDKPVDIYPHRGYRYNLDGKLILTCLTVSKNELFRFSPNGKLIAHSVNGIIYDENGNIIGNAK